MDLYNEHPLSNVKGMLNRGSMNKYILCAPWQTNVPTTMCNALDSNIHVGLGLILLAFCIQTRNNHVSRGKNCNLSNCYV